MHLKQKKYTKKTSINNASTMSTEITNASFLIIVESPSKCTKIETYLGNDYRCIASKGHIRELLGLKNIDIKNNFQPTFTIIPEKGDHVKRMREVISHFKKQNIILAMDDDREGEGIAWHICEVFNLPIKTTTRIVFHEITQTAIQEAIKNPKTIDINLVYAQQTRQILDILVGFKVSPHLWKHVRNGKSNALSAGRCQTPALRLIYDNMKEQHESGLEKRYKTIGYFTIHNLEFNLGKEFEKEDVMESFLNKSIDHKHIMNIGKDKNVIKGAPKPFNTSKLLQVASNKLNTSPKQTMSLSQTLYQSGLITYMRTDSTKYAGAFLEIAQKYIVKEYGGEEYVGDLSAIENKDKSNPHEGIRVTDIRITEYPHECSGREASMYKLIWRNTVESCMSSAKYLATYLSITAPISIYEHTIEIPTFLGWKKVSDKMPDQSELTSLKMFMKGYQGKEVSYNRIESKVVIRNKISYLTEASLIQTLEKLGIGRPSTYAMLSDTIQARGYVKCVDIDGDPTKCVEFTLRKDEILEKQILKKIFGKEKNKLLIQPVGILCIEFLIKHFNELFSYDYTKNMELELDGIAFIENDTTNEWYDLCTKCVAEIDRLSKPLSKLAKEKYRIDDTNEVIFSQYGPSIKETMKDGTVKFHALKTQNISLDKLREGGYGLDELIAVKNSLLGEYEGHPLELKKGKYGAYLEWGDNRENAREWKDDLDKLTFDDAVKIIESNKTLIKTKGTLRNLGKTMSIRAGKFGKYIYYKTDSMKDPKFFPLKKCPHLYETCEIDDMISWVTDTYLSK
jgi:DNA topoisomerase-1